MLLSYLTIHFPGVVTMYKVYVNDNVVGRFQNKSRAIALVNIRVQYCCVIDRVTLKKQNRTLLSRDGLLLGLNNPARQLT